MEVYENEKTRFIRSVSARSFHESILLEEFIKTYEETFNSDPFKFSKALMEMRDDVLSGSESVLDKSST